MDDHQTACNSVKIAVGYYENAVWSDRKTFSFQLACVQVAHTFFQTEETQPKTIPYLADRRELELHVQEVFGSLTNSCVVPCMTNGSADLKCVDAKGEYFEKL